MDKQYFAGCLRNILNNIALVEKFIEGKTFDELKQDDKTAFAMTYTIEMIGEIIQKIPIACREQHPTVPWEGFTQLRNDLLHLYFDVDAKTIWNTATEDLRSLKPAVQSMLKDHSC
ncbi:MAG: HepT-like ribonuclease domain-containing protein [Cyanobacteria bacterium J06649_4]